MTAEETMTASRPEDILGFIPHVLGYWPRQSLVAMTLQGRSLGATLRVDLPGPESQERHVEYAERIRDYLASDEKADGVLLAVFTDQGWADGTVARVWLPLLDSLGAVLEVSGMPLRDSWLVGPDYWRSALCEDGDCCPLPGRSTQQIRDSRLNAEMVFRGSLIGSEPASPADAGQEAGGEEASGDQALALAAEQRFHTQLSRQWQSRECFESVLAMWRSSTVADMAREGTLSPTAAGFLRATLRIPAWRDAITVMAAGGYANALRGAEAFGFFEDGAPCAGPLPQDLPEELAALIPGQQNPVPQPMSGTKRNSFPVHHTHEAAGYGEVLLGLAPETPDWAAMESLDGLLGSLAAVGSGEASAACLTLRGWIEWCRGRGSFADALYARALVACPGYRLAELLREVLLRGTLCGWARRPEAAWRRFGGAGA